MTISEAGLRLTESFETLRLESYQDERGIWTIGWGHTGPEVGPGQTITPEHAMLLLELDTHVAQAAVNRLVRVTITQGSFDALVDFAFNVGCGALAGSTLLRKLNAGDLAGAAGQFACWNKVRVRGVLQESAGLTRRRVAEAKLFLA